MSVGGEQRGAAGRTVIYCLVPGELAAKLHDVLRRHFRDDPRVEVIVERRRRERRRVGDRRRAGAAPPRVERRRIRSPSGRRIGERRAALVPTEPLPLPRKARRYADRIAFVERLEPSEEQLADIDTARLVARFQAGEVESFSTLYMRYYERVYGYLRVALNDPHEAEDATQQVFMEVFEALPGYERRRQPFRAWLFSVVRNRAIDSLRRRGKLDVTDPAEIERRREGPAPEEEAPWVLEWISDRDLQILIERLPVPQRQVLMLRFIVGLSSAEIAAVLGRTDKSVRMLQHRALRYLRERLTAMGRAPHHDPRAGSRRPLRRSPVAYSRRFGLIDSGPLR